MKDTCPITGRIHFVLKDEFGNIKDERDIENLVVTAGKGLAAARFKDATSAAVGWLAVGTGAVAEAAGDTALGGELARVATSTPTVTANVISYTATLAAGTGTGSLQEAGLFNAVSAGTLAARKTFAVITKGAADSLSVTWTLTFN